MSKLREQMIQDMTLRGLSPNTHRTYLQAVSQLAQHYGRSPDRISNRDVKAYLFHLHQNKKRSTSTCNVAAAALRFLYHQTLGRSHTDFDIPIARKPSEAPARAEPRRGRSPAIPHTLPEASGALPRRLLDGSACQ